MKALIKKVKDAFLIQRFLYTAAFEKQSVQEHTFLYESFEGKGLNDHALAIFLAVLKKDVAKKYQHIWVVNKEENNPFLEQYRTLENVSFVKISTRKYYHALSRAKYLINNVGFPPYFIKKEEQIYLNTWHGTPLKKLGLDMPNTFGEISNIQKNFYQADYLVLPNRYTVEKIFSAYDLPEHFKEKVLEIGSPRNDLLFQKSSFVQQYLADKLSVDGTKKIVLFAPTWRGGGQTVENNLHTLFSETRELSEKLGDAYHVLLKLHPFLYSFYTQEQADLSVVDNWVDTSQLLAFTDLLISDFSSIVIDFMVKKQPIFIYNKDEESYVENRGLYLSLNQLPFSKTSTIPELVHAITNEGQQKRNDSFLEELLTHENGRVCDTLLALILENKSPLKKQALSVTLSQEEWGENRILVLPNDSVKRELLEKRRERQHLYFRSGKINLTWLDFLFLKKSVHSKKVFNRELRRLFGTTHIKGKEEWQLVLKRSSLIKLKESITRKKT